MIVYHGTTRRSARVIRTEGFRPRGVSRRVWFAQSRHYARQRARHKAKRSGDRPIVLTCSLDLESLASQMGRGRVFNPFLVEDLASATERRLRAAALEVLAVHDAADPGQWVWAGVTDPEPHVRMALVRHLDRLDPATHEDIFQAAVEDPNPEIARLARRQAEGRGVPKLVW